LQDSSRTVGRLPEPPTEGANQRRALNRWCSICGKHWENRCLPKFTNPKFRRKTDIGGYFLEKLKNARETTSQRNLNQQKDEEVVLDRTASLH
jgi:hypothetical protein